MMTLFIDTNVFLTFYHLTSEDIEELKKLTVLIDNKEICLVLTEQVKNEFYRNRGNKIADGLKKFKDAKFTLSFPAFVKDYTAYSDLRKLLKQADEIHAELVKKITHDAQMERLNADDLVSKLFAKSKMIKVDGDLYHSALMRVRLGNPPGKEGSLGDAINWEGLLADVPSGTDIYIVSDDKDFRSHLSDDSINEFLYEEWFQRKEACAFYYSRISSFFKEHFPDITLASDLEKDLLIQKLANSASFASTHSVIAQLAKQTNFSNAQVEELTKIAQVNNQISWIVGDNDVHGFYSALLERYGGAIQPEIAKELAAVVEAGKLEITSDDESSF